MASDKNHRRAAIMAAQFKKSIQEPNEYVKFYIDDQNPNEWWILIYNFAGDNDEFVGGEYLLNVKAPDNFPFDPPQFFFYTDNGVYDTHKKVCISIGEYHRTQYRPALGMSGFINQLWNGMIGWKTLGHGINLKTTDIKTKKLLAASSKNFNRTKYPDIVTMIEDCYKEYSAKWDYSKIPIPTQQRLGINEVANMTTKLDSMEL